MTYQENQTEFKKPLFSVYDFKESTEKEDINENHMQLAAQSNKNEHNENDLKNEPLYIFYSDEYCADFIVNPTIKPEEKLDDNLEKKTILNNRDQVKQSNQRKKFHCNICNKYFANKYTLKYHIQYTHSFEKAYVRCSHCGLQFPDSFGSASQLVARNNKHFFCTMCQQKIVEKQYSNTYNQMPIHPVEKPFQCDQCNKDFSQTNGLAYHKKSHTLKQPFYCDYCPMRFASRGHLSYHIRRQHKLVP